MFSEIFYSLKKSYDSENLEYHLFECEQGSTSNKWRVSPKSLCTAMDNDSSQIEYNGQNRRQILLNIIDLDENGENICGNCMKTFFKTK